MNTIAVIGAGTMGNGIAHTFAQSGFTVKLIDISEKSLEKGMATIAANLDRMVTKGSITEEDKHKTIGNIITYTDVKDGVVGDNISDSFVFVFFGDTSFCYHSVKVSGDSCHSFF